MLRRGNLSRFSLCTIRKVVDQADKRALRIVGNESAYRLGREEILRRCVVDPECRETIASFALANLSES